MNIRRIASLTALVSFSMLAASSIVLYIAPQGRVAYWADWRLLGLTKTDWGNIHINLGLLLLFSIGLHAYYNWGPMLTYLKNKARRLRVFTPEFNVALMVTLCVAAGTYFLIPPFSWVMGLNASFKDAAAEKYGEPPYGHAELSSLKTFVEKVGLDAAEAGERLHAAGIAVEDDHQTLLEIAAANGIPPQHIYSAILPALPAAVAKRPTAMPENPEPGTGRRTLAEVCAAYGLNLPDVLRGLSEENIGSTAEMTLRQIAEAHRRSTPDVYAVIRKVGRSEVP